MNIQESVNKSLKEHPLYFAIGQKLLEQNTCFICGIVLSESLLQPMKKISGKHAFHLESTHGIPREVLKDMINDSLHNAYFHGEGTQVQTNHI